MLQQTQIPRVLEKYPRFLRRFPTIEALASASLSDIMSLWHGMGYNRRALYLKRAAKYMAMHHKNCIPKTELELRALPGVGPYSARAILCFAHGICTPFIETNIRRVIINEYFQKKQAIDDTDILAILQELQPKKNRREWYWALMDYGRDALRGIPNPNTKSRHYVKQSRFEGSSRYIRAKIISYLVENKKATAEELRASLKKDKYLIDIGRTGFAKTIAALQKEKIITCSQDIFQIP